MAIADCNYKQLGMGHTVGESANRAIGGVHSLEQVARMLDIADIEQKADCKLDLVHYMAAPVQQSVLQQAVSEGRKND